MTDQGVVFVVLAAALVLFVWGRWRYDVVALAALLGIVLTGVVPADEAFLGFGHPAVVTVAAVLVISRGLGNAGVVDVIGGRLSRLDQRPLLQLLAMTGLVVLLSGFMNNIGALSLLMSVAIQVARKNGQSPSRYLMPLAFGSILGGMFTLIGTPPNIIIAGIRRKELGEPFGLFDFTPVGGLVVLAGWLFVGLVGWRLIPCRQGEAGERLFHIEDYITEVRVPEESELSGRPLRELYDKSDADVAVVAVIRGDQRLAAPSSFERIRAEDVLVIEADSEALKGFLNATGFELVAEQEIDMEVLGSDEVQLIEAVATPNARLVGRSAGGLSLGWRYGVNVLAVARQGRQLNTRLSQVRFAPGDVLLLQGPRDALREALPELGCLPLAERNLQLNQPRRIALAVGIFAAAIVLSALDLVTAPAALVAAAVTLVGARLLSIKEAYESIDWSIIVLLGAMIPVGEALETTGGAGLIAETLLRLGSALTSPAMLTILLVSTMLLSNVVNNAAAALLMAPIGLSLARGLQTSADPFLMAVAVGASAAFLTPIGHQSSALVMGAGGYKFRDYWRMGLPLSVLVAAVAVPAILWWWRDA